MSINELYGLTHLYTQFCIIQVMSYIEYNSSHLHQGPVSQADKLSPYILLSLLDSSLEMPMGPT